MNIHSLWFVAVAAALAGCVEEQPEVAYHQPLTSPGGEFTTVPPAVQNSVRAQVGCAEIINVAKDDSSGATIYEFTFRYPEIYPPLYVATDGSVLAPDMTVAVGATADTIAASTGSAASGVKLGDLPPSVIKTLREQAPTGEVDSISRITSGRDVFYDIFFKDPARHPPLFISDNGHLVK
jgi:hypothetical protein